MKLKLKKIYKHFYLHAGLIIPITDLVLDTAKELKMKEEMADIRSSLPEKG